METKETILAARMQECDIQAKDIVDKIGMLKNERYTVVVYISRFEGLGNKNSDFDVYVLTEEYTERDTIMVKINRAVCDIEFWSYDCIFKMLSARIEADEYKTIKLFKRLEIGLPIYNNCELYGKLEVQLQEINLDKTVYSFFKSVTNEEYDDAVKMYKCGEYISALTCARRCADNMIAAYNTKMGHSNLNLKWAPKIFFDYNGYDNTFIKNGYNKYQLYMDVTKENINLKIEEMLEFLTDAIPHIAMEEK